MSTELFADVLAHRAYRLGAASRLPRNDHLILAPTKLLDDRGLSRAQNGFMLFRSSFGDYGPAGT